MKYLFLIAALIAGGVWTYDYYFTEPPPLVVVPNTIDYETLDSDYAPLRNLQKGVSFKLYAPTSMFTGFALVPESISGGLEAPRLYQVRFIYRDTDGDSVTISEYSFQDVLDFAGQTEAEYFYGTTKKTYDGKDVYLARGYDINGSHGLQHVGGATFLESGTVIKVSYFSKQLLSDDDFIKILATFAPADDL